MRPALFVTTLAVFALVLVGSSLADDPGAGQTPAARKPKSAPNENGKAWTGILSEEEFKKLHTLRDDASPAPRGETIELAGGHAYLSLPSGEGPFPGVVVIHEWWGLNDHIRHWSDRLAADGYAALAVDLFGGTVAKTPDEAMAAIKAVDEKQALAVLAAARDFLRKDERVRAPKLATIGWCFGGGWSLRSAIEWGEGLDAAVIYYGQLVEDPAQIEKIDAAILGVFGTKDTGIPAPAVDSFEKALNTANVEHRILRFDAEHAFANPSGTRYDEEDAKQAWAATRDFLAKELKPD